MTESRIQDWIRYVQERAENVAPDDQDIDGENVSEEQSVVPQALSTPQALIAAPETIVAVEEAPSAAVARTGTRIRKVAARNGKASPPSGAVPSTATVPESSQMMPIPATTLVQPTSISDSPAAHARNGQHATAPEPGVMKVAVSGGGEARQRVRQRPETRAQMLDRLLNPTISLYEASVLLNVCSATVRRYTNSGVLPDTRTEGGQRRFRLREVLALMREMEAKKKS